MDTYWYVRARHDESGREIQRISNGGGATSESEAAMDMRQYLLKTTLLEVNAWYVVEVARWSADIAPPLVARRVGASQSRRLFEFRPASESSG